jgi:cytochrome c oxidase cbb3-type subunit 2
LFVAAAEFKDGKGLLDHYCRTCHETGGATRRTWQASFKRLPPDLRVLDPSVARRGRISRIVKFGLPGTDMPGHEYLSDNQVASLSLWLVGSLTLAVPTQTFITSQENHDENQ